MGKKFNDALQKARMITVDKDYYANTYVDNIYLPQMAEKHIRMFCKGEGKELLPKDGKKEKGACIFSSSMLAYNFFSWIDKNHPLLFDGVRYDRVVFEEQFRVLKTRNNKANLDVVLVSEDEKTILLIESKFTEHFKLGPVEISEAYDDPKSYFDNVKGWVPIIKQIRDRMDSGDEAYFEGIKQVACHLIGISSVILNNEARDWFNHNSWLHHIEGLNLKGNETFIFKSIVFLPNTKDEKSRAEDYAALNRKFASGISFLPSNLLIDNPIITYRDIWDMGLKTSITDNDLKVFLEKYLLVHA
jgi:hypothetical protein